MNFLVSGGRATQNKPSPSSDTMISIQNLSKGFERENLFENINLVIHSNDKIVLVGKNGSGKTTFFKCIAGIEDFAGRILIQDIKISLMEQEQNFSNLDKTFDEYLKDKADKFEEKKKNLEKQIGEPSAYEDEEKFNSLMDEYNLLLTDTSFDMEQESTREILKILNIDEIVLNQKIKNLSGGQKTKLRLAECLSKKADLYLLDEPTNNLDLQTREWLEGYINRNIKSLIVISHDRYFLNKVAEKVWDLENKKFKEWPYKFKKYLDMKKDHIENLKQKYHDAMKKKAQLLESAKEKRLWVIKAHGGSKSKSWKAIAERLEREAEELDKTENPADFIDEVEIEFSKKDLHNCTIFRLEDVSKKFDKILFEKVNQEIDHGEKICIVGENGTGKSTLLKILVRLDSPTSGEIYRRKDLNIGYFDQELAGIDKEKTMMEFLLEETRKNEGELISILLKYGFKKEAFQKKIKFLSGGEKGRLNILRIAHEKNEILILDEPTNNLDIYLMESLETALKNFDGTVIFVSHDRYFVDKVANRILEIKDKKISSFKGNYSEYLESPER